jgi:hypothetical protein
VPQPCQNGRETAVTGGHPRAPRMASDLGTRRLTPCLQRPSKQRVAGSNPAGRADLRLYLLDAACAGGLLIR